MKKSDVIRSMQVTFINMRSTDAAAILRCITDTIVESVSKGDRVEIREFGNFQRRMHTARNGFDPQTHKLVKIPADYTILFKPSTELTKKMNG